MCTSSERSGLKFNQQIQATLILSISTIYCLCAKWLTAFGFFPFYPQPLRWLVQRNHRRQTIFSEFKYPRRQHYYQRHRYRSLAENILDLIFPPHHTNIYNIISLTLIKGRKCDSLF